MALEDVFPTENLSDREVRVLLVDSDPISRHVLANVLRTADNIQLVDCVDSDQLNRACAADPSIDMVVLSFAPYEDPFGLVRDLATKSKFVLLIGTTWSRQRMDTAFAAGAAGCLIKDTQVGTLAAAVQAVASGHTVISPKLHGLYAPASIAAQGQRLSEPRGAIAPDRLVDALTAREHEVLALLAQGTSTAEAAAALRVSPATVKSHVSHALAKLGVRNRVEAVLLVRRLLDGGHGRHGRTTIGPPLQLTGPAVPTPSGSGHRR